MTPCRVDVTADLVIAAGGERMLVACVEPPRHPVMRGLIATPAPLAVRARTRWAPVWRGVQLAGVELRALLTTTAGESALHVRFGLPASRRTLGRHPDRVVLVEPAGWQELDACKSLRRGLMLTAGPPEVLAELLDDPSSC